MTGPLQIVLGTISVLFLIVASVLAYRAVRGDGRGSSAPASPTAPGSGPVGPG